MGIGAFLPPLLRCLALAALAAPAAQAALPPQVAQALKAAGIPEQAAAAFVQQVGSARPAVLHNADAALNPASVMKLVTTYAALELLGPAYTWKTEVYAAGALRGEALEGDLVIKGYGDPKLNLENFWLLTRRLRLAGVKDIRGDLVVDASHFAVKNGDPGAFDARPFRAYNVGPEALLVNYRVVNLRLTPDPGARRVQVSADPVPGPLELANGLRLTDGPCNDWRGDLNADIRAAGGRASIALNGTYAAACGEKSYLLALYDSEQYVLGLFRELWASQGGTLGGRLRSGRVPDGARLLFAHESPPLAEIVRDINKHSNNVMARQLFLTLGAGGGGEPATLEKAREAVQGWVAGRKLDFPELVMDNGAGLSRSERISARHLGELLLAAFASPVMPELMASLPISGVDGTMKKRLNGSGVAGQAHIKTGLLEGVRSFAGYLLDAAGQRWVVVLVVNHPKAGAAQAAHDALLEWVHTAARGRACCRR